MFDKVLKPNVTQHQVYDAAAKSIVKGKFFFFIKYHLNSILYDSSMTVQQKIFKKYIYKAVFFIVL